MNDLERLDFNIRLLNCLRKERAEIDDRINALIDETDRVRERVKASPALETAHG